MPNYHTFREWPKTTLGVTVKKTFKKPKKPKNPGNLENLLDPSYDLTTWTKSGVPPTVLFDQPGLDAVSNTGTIVWDPSSINTENISKNVVIDDDSKLLVWRFLFRKDLEENRFPQFNCELTGGTAQFVRLQINTKTGALLERTGEPAVGTVAYEANEVSLGGLAWWELVVSVQNNSSGNTTAETVIAPAFATTFGGAQATAIGSVRVGEVELFHNAKVSKVKGHAPVYLPVPPATTPLYNPCFMVQDGIAGTYYRKSPVTFSGTKAYAIVRINKDTWLADDWTQVVNLTGTSSNGRSRLKFLVYSNDYTADTELQGKVRVIATDTSSGLDILDLLSDVVVLDGEDHIIFASYDSTNGLATFAIDDALADDVGYSNRILTTGTIPSGTAGLIDVGQATTKPYAGKVGFISAGDAYLTNWQDFINADGTPKEMDVHTWAETDNVQPMFYKDTGEMDANDGSDGNLTLNGGIVGPVCGDPPETVAIRVDKVGISSVQSMSIGLTALAPVEGRLMLLFAMNDTSGGASGFNTPAGWTSIGEAKSNLTDVVIAAWYKVAGASEADFTLSWTGGNSNGCIAWSQYLDENAETVSPVDVSNFAAAASVAASYAIPSVTTTVDATRVFYGLVFDGADGFPFSVSGTGWSETDEDQIVGGVGLGPSACFGEKQQYVAGATGDATVTPSVTDGAAYFQIAIKPK